MFEYTIEKSFDSACVHCKGDTIDFGGGPLQKISELLDQGIRRIMLDMSGVEYLNSSGISTLLSIEEITREKGGKIALYNLQSQVDKVIRLTRMQSVLPCFDDKAEAARYVGIIEGSSRMTKNEEIFIIEENLNISRQVKIAFEDFHHLLMYKVESYNDFEKLHTDIQDCQTQSLVILDVGCNPVKSMTFLEKLKSDEKTRNIPVIVATKDESISRAYYLVRNGASDILRYPFNKYEFECRLRAALQTQSKESACTDKTPWLFG